MSIGRNTSMPALQFEMNLLKLVKSKIRGMRHPSGYWRPGGAVNISRYPLPQLIDDDWVIIETALSGICGSDMKEVTLSGAMDNPIQSLISFPQIMGHEVVGIIQKVGPAVKKVKPGDRVAVSPWFTCGPRGVKPYCDRCKEGDYTHCSSFQKGNIPTGMHLGVAKGFGGFAPYVSVHESQCFIIPEKVGFEDAVLADPFAVAFHSCISLAPDPDTTIFVYGLGIIGLLTIQCLKKVFQVEHVLAVGRYSFQKELAMEAGAEHVFLSSGETLIQEVAAYTDAELYTPSKGLKWTMDGVDGIIDTIASSSTLEAGMRFLAAQGKLVFTGVDTPKRCENTPHYFKELEIIGSNGFSVETFEGKRAHGFDFFLEFLTQKRIEMKGMVTHRFPLEKYQAAFDILSDKKESKAVKVVFYFSNRQTVF